MLSSPAWADILDPTPFDTLRWDFENWWSNSAILVCLVAILALILVAILIWKRKNKYVKIINRCLIILVSIAILWDISYLPEVQGIMYSIKSNMCPKNKPLFNGEKCFSCDEPMTIVGITNCEVCPNRESWYECGPSCILKNSPGPEYMYVQCDGWIKKCTSGVLGRDGECYSCGDFNMFISKEDCLTCPNAQYIEGYGCAPNCPEDRPLFNGWCQPCDLVEGSQEVMTGCDKCPNRFEYGNGCYQKCPDDKPILSLDTGECYACSDEVFQQYDNQKKCDGNTCQMVVRWSPHDVLGCSKCSNKIYNSNCRDGENFSNENQ